MRTKSNAKFHYEKVNGTVQPGAGGGHCSVAGNLLTLKQNGFRDAGFVDTGLTFHGVEPAESTIVLQKQ